MKFLVAGLGSIGRRHLRNLIALGEQDIVLYRTHHSTLPDDELAGFPVETDLNAALDLEPDAVIVSNPTALHLDVAIPAAEAGCHLFLEKPISHSMDHVDDLLDAVRRNRSKVFVGFQFRFHPGLRKINKLLSAGAIGRPLSVRAHWGEYLPGWHPWEDYKQSYSARSDLGGGVVLTLCHPLDYLRMFFGDVSQLWSFTGKASDLDLGVEDSAEIGLRFQNGVIGSVHVNYVQRPQKHDLEIVGTQGTLYWDNADGGIYLFQADPDHVENFPLPKGFDRNDLFVAEMRNFLAMLRGEEDAACSLEDGVQALQIAMGILRSSQEGRIVNF